MIPFFILTCLVPGFAIYASIITVRAIKQRKIDTLEISFGTHPVGFVVACCVYVALDIGLVIYSVSAVKDFIEYYSFFSTR
jgi:hypothetical protein